MENIKNKDEFLFLMRKVFPFAYNLYGDDLAAQELISDSLHRLILKDDKLVSDITWKELISSMYFLINRNFKLAEKVSGAFSRLSLVEKAILTLVHGHVISFSFIFFILGGLMLLTSYSLGLKKSMKTPINTCV